MTATLLTKPQGNRLYVPLSLSDQGTQLPDAMVVQFGRREVRVHPTWTARGGEILLDEHMLDYLRLQARPIGVRASHGRIHLGPVLAAYALPFDGKRPFGPQTALFAEMSKICQAHGAAFMVLTPGSLAFDRRETMAMQLAPDGVWRRSVAPWPDFVWRRATVRPIHLADQLDHDESIMRNHVINGALLRTESEKWQIYQELRQSTDVAPYLPQTVLVQHVDDVLRAARRWGDVYVKPARGTQGQQIVRLLAHKDAYEIRTHGRARTRGRSALRRIDERAVLRFFRARLRAREQYIVQETVALLKTANGQPFDVRYLIQARPDEHATCTAAVMKLGMRDAVTTNLHTGGQALPCEQLEDLLRSEDRSRFRAGLRAGEQLAIAAFTHLSATRTGLAEMGIDVALDVKGNVKLLEVNPCPGRRMLREVSPSLRRLSLVRLVEYAVFCTGF